jgi:pyrimidine operon attenuation protein/uracil phosphoribosyltransferase
MTTTPAPACAPDAEAAYAKLRADIAAALTRSGAPPALIGIHTGGAWVAERLARDLQLRELGFVDISFYRDDFAQSGLHAQVQPTAIGFDINNRDVLLVDDVLHNGRTVRAAMNALFDYGRPARIALAVLVERLPDPAAAWAWRELPVSATFAGARVVLPTESYLTLARQDESGADRRQFMLQLHQARPWSSQTSHPYTPLA